MNTLFENEQYTIDMAAPQDSADIKKLFEQISYNYLIDLQFRRGEDPYQSFEKEDAGASVLLLHEKRTGNAIGMGACSFHDVYLNGTIKRSGYLNSLKLLPEYRRKVRCLAQAFRTMHEATASQVDVYYATILSQATDIQQIFERGHRNMPVYEKQCAYTSFLWRPCASEKGLHLEKGNVAGLDDFYSRNFSQYNLAPVRRQLTGVQDDDFIVWREGGRILAACAIWNNQKSKNYYINAYGGILKAVSHFPLRLVGYPSFPPAGHTVNNACLSLLMFDREVDRASQARFIQATSSYAREYDMIGTGLTDTNPAYRAFEKIRHAKLSSYLYTVNWDEPQRITDRPVFADISFM